MSGSRTLVLEPVGCAEPFGGFRVGDLRFPLSGEQADAVRALCIHLLTACGKVGAGQPTVWLDSRPLHLNGGSKLYAERGAAWGSRWGFGFDPAARPPRKIEFEDFLELTFGEQMRIDQRSNFSVRNITHSMEAYGVMGGRGVCTILVFADTDLEAAAERYMTHTRDVLYKRFPPGEFGSYRYYLPLLSSTALAAAAASQIADWMGESKVYLREAFDTGELLLVTAQPAGALLEAAGLRALSVAAETPWEFSPSKEPAL